MKTATLSDAQLLAKANNRACFLELYWRHTTTLRHFLWVYFDCDFAAETLDAVMSEFWDVVRAHPRDLRRRWNVLKSDSVEHTFAQVLVQVCEEYMSDTAAA